MSLALLSIPDPNFDFLKNILSLFMACTQGKVAVGMHDQGESFVGFHWLDLVRHSCLGVLVYFSSDEIPSSRYCIFSLMQLNTLLAYCKNGSFKCYKLRVSGELSWVRAKVTD
jgi:hypothetical protein